MQIWFGMALQHLHCAHLEECIFKGVLRMEYQVTIHEDEKCIVRVHKPILSAEERKAREDEIKKALVTFYKETRCNR